MVDAKETQTEECSVEEKFSWVCSGLCEACHNYTDCAWYNKQLKWKQFYCRVAQNFASLSKDPRLKVGCVIVTPSGVVYPGYNGDEIGGSNQHDSPEPGQSGFIHAEENAIIKFSPTLHPNSKMYLSHSPCLMCARRIINTQAITHVYYVEEYRLIDGPELLRRRGIICEKVEV